MGLDPGVSTHSLKPHGAKPGPVGEGAATSQSLGSPLPLSLFACLPTAPAPVRPEHRELVSAPPRRGTGLSEMTTESDKHYGTTL